MFSGRKRGATMKQHESKYIPAFSFKILIPLYDTFFKATMREEFFKDRLIKEANIQPGNQMLVWDVVQAL
jgi:hypothetical protein